MLANIEKIYIYICGIKKRTFYIHFEGLTKSLSEWSSSNIVAKFGPRIENNDLFQQKHSIQFPDMTNDVQ